MTAVCVQYADATEKVIVAKFTGLQSPETYPHQDEIDDTDARYIAYLATGHWAALRARRDGLLAASDWTQMADSPLSAEVKTAWTTYRQALRDLPANTTDPATPDWPSPPMSSESQETL